jgi:hypothetical protein
MGHYQFELVGKNADLLKTQRRQLGDFAQIRLSQQCHRRTERLVPRALQVLLQQHPIAFVTSSQRADLIRLEFVTLRIVAKLALPSP